MNAPHRRGRGARSRARCVGLAIVVEEEIAPRKRAGFKFPRGTCECAAEVIGGVGVLSRKSRSGTSTLISDSRGFTSVASANIAPYTIAPRMQSVTTKRKRVGMGANP